MQEEPGFRSGLRELYDCMSVKRRRQLQLVLLLMLAGAIAELATIGAVLPFLALLSDPTRLDRFALLAGGFKFLGATTPEREVVAAAVLFIVLACIAAAVRLQLSWSSQNFVFRLGHDLAVNIQRRILHQPFTFHITHNTSSLIASLDKVPMLVWYVLLQLMQAAIAVVISVFIVAVLVAIDPFTALTSAALLTLIYVTVSAVMRARLSRNSQVVGSTWDERVKIVQESLGGIRDVIIDGSQLAYLDVFRRADDRFSSAKTSTAFIAAAPRFVIEGLGLALIAVLAVVLADRRGGVPAAIPILGALALGSQRLLPMLQTIYVSWSVAVGNNSVLHQVLQLLRLPINEERKLDGRSLPLKRQIELDGVSFIYPSRRTPAISRISLKIRRGECVALIGKSGSGKSTLVDLLTGLLEPTEGCIRIDGTALTSEHKREWLQNIAHVPQAIFLADATIAQNIAFGAADTDIDFQRVWEAARKAQLDEFVATLSEGLDTRVGERGIRLSGGQRQRLGIARAIYRDAAVLVLDEATSALDDDTEAAVMQTIERLREEGRTIIIIAHRLSTVRRADRLIRLETGRVIQTGTYDEIVGATRSQKSI